MYLAPLVSVLWEFLVKKTHIFGQKGQFLKLLNTFFLEIFIRKKPYL